MTRGSTSGMPDISSAGSVNDKYRRNGKLQSCEPCRKQKLRCDHCIPCGRCVKKRKTSACFYHPNPMTQQNRQSPPTSLPTPTSPASQFSPQTLQLQQSVDLYDDSARIKSARPPFRLSNDGLDTTFTFNSSPALEVNHAQCQSFHRAASAPPLDCVPKSDTRRNTGFHGPTSHFSILEETLGALEPEPVDLNAMDDDQQQSIVVTSSRIAQGCEVLAFFANRHMIERFIARYHETCDGDNTIIPNIITTTWLQQLYQCHATVLTSTAKQDSRGLRLRTPDPAKIRKLSEDIWRNTLTPLDFDGTISMREWAKLGTGAGLRWEVLGHIAMSIGLVLIETASSDPIYEETKVVRSCVMRRMQEIVESCLAFCRHCEVLDDSFIWLLNGHSVMTQAMKGDRHYATYRASGEECSAVIAMGLHQVNRPSAKVPFFLTELRKRAFLAAYYGEISLATCLGRPPRLSYRYCAIDPPLDLTDAQLALTGDKLAEALATLDEGGFSTTGVHVRIHTSMRAWAQYIQRREDVLDLALGTHTREEIMARAKQVQTKTESHAASLPAWLQSHYLEPFDFLERKHLKPLEIIRIGGLRTGSQAIEILLQRVLIRKTGASSERLILAARRVFRDVLQVTAQHEFAALFQATYHLYLYGHGLRSAAVVAVELLKQEMLPVYPADPLLPRSETIQDLSVFAARLAAVRTGGVSSNLCEQGHRVLSKILDRILSPGGARREGEKGCASQSQVAQARPLGGVGSGGQVQGAVAQQVDCEGPLYAADPLLNSMVMDMADTPGGGMMDIGIGIEAPGDLGQDMDFVRLLDTMNWGMDNWSM